MFCKHCGAEISDTDAFCPKCGAKTEKEATKAHEDNITATPVTVSLPDSEVSHCSWLVTFLLSILVGGLGIHRFYVGKVGTGILWLFTFGLFGVGYLIDLVLVVLSRFTDKDGKVIQYNPKEFSNL